MKNSTAFILVLISAGLFYTFIMPQYDKATALRADAASYEAVLANISALSASRDALLVRYKALPADQVAKLSNALPDHVDTVALAVDLDAIASKYGISLKSVTSAGNSTPTTNAVVATAPASANGGGYGYTDVNVSFISTYDNFKKFLTDVEKSLRIMDVRAVNFTVTDSGLAQYDLVIRTYWLK